MTDNRYFFREGYSPEEMASRLHASDFRDMSNSIVSNMVSESEVTEEDLRENRKGEFINILRRKLGREDYESFLEELFEDQGKKGDRANFQLYTGSGLSYPELIESVEENINQKDPEELTGRAVSDRIVDYDEDQDREIIDIKFSLSETEAVLEVDRVDNVDLDELEEEVLTSTNYFTAEVRIYTEFDIIVVSNRGLNKERKNQIRRTISDWADGTTTPSQNLQENELLTIQNLMDGENSGLDFGEFRERNLNSAKYRGDRTEALTRSRVVVPAQEDGQITQVRFYYQYTGGGADRSVQVRVHGDGHITTSRPTEPDFISEVVNCLDIVQEYRDYLSTLDSRIEEFIDAKFAQQILDGEREYKSRKHQTFGNLVNGFVDDDYEDVELQAYEAAIANIGCELLQSGLERDNIPDIDSATERPPEESELKGFFDDFAEYELERPNYDFDLFWDYLYHILTYQHNSPISIIETVVSEYEL